MKIIGIRLSRLEKLKLCFSPHCPQFDDLYAGRD